MKFKFDIEKANASIKLILVNFENGIADFHKIFKILYFAEQKHLSTFGRLIFYDHYIAMKNGPVPSSVYDIFKTLKADSIFTLNSKIDFKNEYKIIDDFYIQLLNKDINTDIFSETELECLSQSIEENKLLDFNTLASKSHDSAWENTSPNDEISVFQIAKAAGANDEMLKYINLNFENDLVF